LRDLEPRDRFKVKPSVKVAVKGGRLIDGTGNPPAKNVTVLIEDSQIVQVGDHVQTPNDAKVIDADGMTIMPGLMNAHTHLASVEAPGGAGSPESMLTMLSSPPSLLILYAVKHARELLEAGFTTVRDLGVFPATPPTHGELTFMVSLRKAISLGLVPGPRIMVAGLIGMTAGHCDMMKPSYLLRGPDETVDGVWALRKRVRELLRENVDLIKTFSGAGVVGGEGESVSWTNYTVEELAAIVDEAHTHGKKVSCHAHTGLSIRNALEAGVDTIEHGLFIDDEAIEMMIRKKAFLVTTLTPFSERGGIATAEKESVVQRAKEGMQASADSFRRAHEAGVKIAMGTDHWIQWPPRVMFGDDAYELELMVKYGMSEMESIVSSTKNTSGAMGIEHEVGTIEKGKQADMIIIDGDPLKDIRILQDKTRIRKVMKGGQIVVSRGD
jgi:imidazolonepropionase-like amidohydrolase